MTEMSARLGLPFLQPGQAQKEVYHNEALAMLDIALHAAVQSVGLAQPPAEPSVGKCWIVGSDATGAWSGRTGAIAGWTTGGWRFVLPTEGMLAWSITGGFWLQWTGGEWVAGKLAAMGVWIGGVQVVGPQGAAINSPDGGSTVDTEARAAIDLIVHALRAHGLIAA